MDASSNSKADKARESIEDTVAGVLASSYLAVIAFVQAFTSATVWSAIRKCVAAGGGGGRGGDGDGGGATTPPTHTHRQNTTTNKQNQRVIKPLTAIVVFHWLLMGALLLPVDVVLKLAGLVLRRGGPVRSVPFRRWAKATLTWMVYPLTTALLVKRAFRAPLAAVFESTLAEIDPKGAAELKDRPASKVVMCLCVFS